jgi:protein-S-isoprenylcysteine O-methyltransferase Ste14
MMKKMNRWGVGPAYAAVSLETAAVLMMANLYYLPAFAIPHNDLVFMAGTGLIVAGAIVFLVAAVQVHTSFNRGKLVTGGVYAYMRHPVYAAWILFIVPGIILATGLLLLTALPVIMYLLLRALADREEAYMVQEFGNVYLDYRSRVNPVLPVPKNMFAKVKRG